MSREPNVFHFACGARFLKCLKCASFRDGDHEGVVAGAAHGRIQSVEFHADGSAELTFMPKSSRCFRRLDSSKFLFKSATDEGQPHGVFLTEADHALEAKLRSGSAHRRRISEKH